MKLSLCAAMLCVLLLASQFGCSNSKQPKAVTEKTVPSANAVAASPEVEDLNRLISKLTYYRSPKNLQAAKPQSIEEIKATFGKQAPDVDPVIEGIYKELSDKYKNNSDFLLKLNNQFLRYLFMIEDEKRFTTLVNQMPEIRTSEVVYKKDDLLNMLKKIKMIDRAIQNSAGSYEKLIKMFYSPKDSWEKADLYSEMEKGGLFAMQTSPGACEGSVESDQFSRRIEQFHKLLLDTVKDDSDPSRLEQILDKVNVIGIGSPIKGQEFSEGDYQQLAKVVIDARHQKIKSLKSEFGIAATNGVPSQSNIYKVSKLFYLIDLDWIRTEGAVKGYLLIKKSGKEFLPILYIEQGVPTC